MNDETAPTTVADDERLARFVVHHRWVRSNGTIRPDAFMPDPHLELSVTRHIGLSDCEIWDLGRAVAELRRARLLGRADITAHGVRGQSLRIVPTPPPRNHADITGWPGEKPAQKILALALAAEAGYLPHLV